MKKTVLMPIEVPVGDFCWKCCGDDSVICQHFDNEGGHPHCELGFFNRETTPEGYVRKPTKCAELPDG